MRLAMMMVRETVEVPYGTPVHDLTDDDRIDNLGESIAVLAAQIHAATHRLLTLIAEFDRERGWERVGYPNCARWLSVRTGIDLGAAREKVRAARALARLPMTGAAMARGELSFSQVRSLTRIATEDNEQALLDLARGATTAELERMVRGWRKGSREDEAERERRQHEDRALSVFPDDDGMYVVRGRLTPEVGALFMRALEAASGALFREPGAEPTRVSSDREAAYRRADGIGLLAERAFAAGFGGSDGPAPVSGTRAERYQVVLHVEPATLTETEEPGRSELEDGTRVSAETSRRLSCDASVVRVAQKPDGTVLDVGRRARTVPTSIRRALEVRDRGCRFPGCGLRFTDAHHVHHWGDGGKTSLDNCLLLCAYHHRRVHEGGWRVGWWGTGRPVFYDPRGGTHFEGRWQPPELGADPVGELIQANAFQGLRPDVSRVGDDPVPDDLFLVQRTPLAQPQGG